MYDPSSRGWKILDAISQLLNVALLPWHKTTTSNESISGRSFREGWRSEKYIDRLFFWQDRHCMNAHLKDVARAYDLLLTLTKDNQLTSTSNFHARAGQGI